MIGKLAHPVQISLQATQEDKLKITRNRSVVRSVQILVVQCYLISGLVNQGTDMEAVYRLQDIGGAALAPIPAQVGGNDDNLFHTSHTKDLWYYLNMEVL